MSEQPSNERCICRELVDHLKELFPPHSEAAREHFRNSRLEFLKAVRTVIDERIDHLSAAPPTPGAKVPVE